MSSPDESAKPMANTKLPGADIHCTRRLALYGIGLLVLALLIAGAVVIVPNLRERAAIAEIVKSGGKVQYTHDGPWESGGLLFNNGSMFPLVYGVDLGFRDVSEETLAHVSELGNPHKLWLHGSTVTDDNLKALARIPELRQLTLDRTSITDAGLMQVSQHAHFRELSFRETRITDAGLAHLRNLKDLRVLELNDNSITDAGLKHFCGLDVWILDIGRTSVTDAGLADLHCLPNLHFLAVYGTRVSIPAVKDFETQQPTCRIDYGQN